MNNDKISKELGIRPLSEISDAEIVSEEVVIAPPAVVIEEDDENLADIELARTNVKNIINMGDDAVKEMLEIAKQSESARGFEVVATLMKTLLDANKDYIDISTKKKFAQEETPQSQTNVTNNNLIVSTADLLKMMKCETDG
jgi:hypothetical protein